MATKQQSLVLSGDDLGLLGACLVHSNVPIPARARLNRGPVIERRADHARSHARRDHTPGHDGFSILLSPGLEGSPVHLQDGASGASGWRGA